MAGESEPVLTRATTPPPGPVHIHSTRSRWSTVNAEEAFPGLLRPLTWSFYGAGTRRAMVALWKDLGALPGRTPVESADTDDWFVGTFYGRSAMNVDLLGQMADRMPGTSAAALEEQFFGVPRSGPSTSTARRYPVVAVKAPIAVLRARRETLDDHPRISRWRQETVQALDGIGTDQALAEMLRAREWLEPVLRRHIMLTMIVQGFFEQVRVLCRGAGLPGHELLVMTSPGGTDELDMMSELGRVSRDPAALPGFLGRHGYHGPDEGHLHGRVWREDPAQLGGLLEDYRSRGTDPDEAAHRQRRRAQDARAELLAALPAGRRPAARALLRMATAMPALRELGKSSFLQVVDVARAAARAIGANRARDGHLDHPDDVFFLTVEELTGPPGELRAHAERRRVEHDQFAAVELPASWTGNPSARPMGPAEAGLDGEICGLGVSAGAVEGTARVVHDPSTADLEPGDILVCRLTDPSWAALMALADGLVIDVGSAVSHGAIVARELGIPCVINTRDGSTRLRSGDRIRIDGTAGSVELLARDEAP